jgi:hypothetical protein
VIERPKSLHEPASAEQPIVFVIAGVLRALLARGGNRNREGILSSSFRVLNTEPALPFE